MINVTIENDDGEEEEYQLPSVMEVCHDCKGHGQVLNESMRNHAYTREEFEDSFDDEEKEHYMTRGGMYDVQCPTCKGTNVIAVIDEEEVNRDHKLKEIFDKWEEWETEKAYVAECDREEGRMERLMGC